MCGGSANSRCLPSIVYGDRTNPAASRPPRASRGRPVLEGGVARRGLQADAVRGAAGDHQDRAGRAGPCGCGSRTRRRAPPGARRAPSRGPAARRGRRATARCRSGGGTRSRGSAARSEPSSASVRWLDPDAAGSAARRRPRRSSAGATSVGASPARAAGAPRRPRRRPRRAAAAASRSSRADEAVPQHRGHPLEHDPRRRALARRPAPGGPRAGRRCGPRAGRSAAGALERPPRRQHQHEPPVGTGWRDLRRPRGTSRPRRCRRRARRPGAASRSRPKP